MGEFERNSNAPKDTDTKKMAIVVVLGVVLIGLVANWYMKKDGPTQAMGAPPAGGASALPAPMVSDEMSPAELARLLAELKNDPTLPLLQPNAKPDLTVNQIPRNPFRMAPVWAAQLTPPQTPVVVDVGPKPTPLIHAPPPVAVVPQGVNPADYKLQLISQDPAQGMVAIINNKNVYVGGVVGAARVLAIHDTSVILQHVNFPNGPTIELVMHVSILGQPN